MSEAPHIVNIDEAEEIAESTGDHWGCFYKVLTPKAPRLGRLGANVSRVPPGKSGCPFHSHQIEDEVFFVLSGRGVLRYGETLTEVGPGDCITCPAGKNVAHQFANPFDEDFVYLGMGMNDANEVCVYPDSGKVMVRALDRVGYLSDAEYYAGEPETPRIFNLIADRAEPGPAGSGTEPPKPG